MVFVDDNPNTAPSAIFEAPHYAAPAVNLHILARAQHLRRKHDGEIYD
jgi:hypothetical protein